LKAVENRQDYLARLQVAIQELHKCGAIYRETVPVAEMFQGKTIWQGSVEVFDLTRHPKAQRCFAWSHREGGNDEGERFVPVLEIPPVVSPETAVKASIMAGGKKHRL
jgi:hypothetical protein